MIRVVWSGGWAGDLTGAAGENAQYLNLLSEAKLYWALVVEDYLSLLIY